MSRAKLAGSLSVFLLAYPHSFSAPAKASELRAAPEVQLDSLEPMHSDRRLRTINLHALVTEMRLDALPLWLRLGVTLSRPPGSITQLEGDYSQDTLHAQTFASSAWGFGPAMQQRLNTASACVRCRSSESVFRLLALARPASRAK